ncbi:MAG: glycosyltransferase family protein [Bdellovibrionales bacterium]|nr:glycosyltransferase family protein [Bdellovibrionales bacterium]
MKSPKYLAILQARLSSTRLPGKVLRPLSGAPMLERQIERIRRSKKISEILVATSTGDDDRAIVELCDRLGVGSFRGNLTDVLDRYVGAARTRQPENVIRLTGDCPLVDPGVIDDVIAFFESGSFDYASNTLEPTFPDGLDTEVFTFEGLEKCWREARLPSEREHVTPYFYTHPELFRLGSYKSAVNRSNLRWTVDEPADYELVQKIYAGCYAENPSFAMADVLRFLEKNPELNRINSEFQRNEGYLRSLAQDRDFIAKKADA